MPVACLQRRPQRLRREEGTLRLQLFFRRLRAAYPQGAGRIRMAAQLPTAARELCEAFVMLKSPSVFRRREIPFLPPRWGLKRYAIRCTGFPAAVSIKRRKSSAVPPCRLPLSYTCPWFLLKMKTKKSGVSATARILS